MRRVDTCREALWTRWVWSALVFVSMVALLLVFAPAGSAATSKTRLVTRSLTSTREPDPYLASPAISANGRFVAFASVRSNLVVGDTNGEQDVFVRDIVAGTTQRVSVSSRGVQANGPSEAEFGSGVDISSNGRYVLFDSDATNLVPSDTNQFPDVFIRDRLKGTTEIVDDVPAIGSWEISGDGRYVAWGPPGHSGTIGRYDRRTHRTATVDVGADGSWVADISYNGGAVLADGARGWRVWHPVSGRLIRFDQALGGKWANRPVTGVALSGDGHKVMFDSRANNLVPGDTNGRTDVFVRNLLTHRTHRASVTNRGTQPNRRSWGLGLSQHGRYRLFGSNATNLIRGDTNGVADVFIRDRHTHTTIRCDVSSTGEQANKAATNPIGFPAGAPLSANGQFVAFVTRSTNLVATPTQAGPDIFIRGPGC